MRLSRTISWLALPVAALAGCGDLRERVTQAASERSAIEAVVAQVVTAQGLLERGDGAGLVAATRIDALAGLLAPADGLPVARAAAAPDLDATCAAFTPDVAHFTACTIGGHTFDGSVGRTAGWVRAELSDVFVTDDGREGAVTVEGSLLRRRLSGSAALLDGSLEIYAVWTDADGAEGLLDATVAAERLVINEAGCAVGGSLQVAGSHGERLSYAPVSRTISFGPECGDLAITP